MKITNTFFLFFCITTLIYSQNNITNTLGTGGVFTIKDGSTTFFSLSQTDGRITLPVTTNPSLGAIFKGTAKFIHDFKPIGADGYNTFMGSNAGNFTMSYVSGSDASYNTAIGHESLSLLTTGYDNTASGSRSLYANTTGHHNTATGSDALYFNTTGNGNTGTGGSSLLTNTTGQW